MFTLDIGVIMLVIAFIDLVAPKGAVGFVKMRSTYARSPRIRRAN